LEKTTRERITLLADAWEHDSKDYQHGAITPSGPGAAGISEALVVSF